LSASTLSDVLFQQREKNKEIALNTARTKLMVCAAVTGASLAGPSCLAAQAMSPEDELRQLRREIEAQRKQLDAQQKRIEELQLKAITGRGAAPPGSSNAQPVDIAQGAGAGTPPDAPSGPVGKPPDTSRPPEIPALVDIRGVLTPRDTIILEPSLQYSHSSNNRVALVGFSIIPAITIGLIDVRSVKRDTFIAALAARYGVTNRFEIEGKIPYAYRHETTLTRPFATPSVADSAFEASGHGIGDVELAARYQVNQPGPDRPYYVAGLRVKSRTGKSPFDVETDPVSGLQRKLPTGSGFWGVQPSITAIFPSDPAVFFGNLSYLHNIKRDVGGNFGTIDPGDAIGFTFGMGVGLNDKASFSIAYDHASVGRTKQNGIAIPTSTRAQLGTLLIGTSYRLSAKTTFNFTLGAGLTEDAPNIQLTFRLPIEL
jgi:hypothetical protein